MPPIRTTTAAMAPRSASTARPIQPCGAPPLAPARSEPRAATAATTSAASVPSASSRLGSGVAFGGQFGAAIQR